MLHARLPEFSDVPSKLDPAVVALFRAHGSTATDRMLEFPGERARVGDREVSDHVMPFVLSVRGP